MKEVHNEKRTYAHRDMHAFSPAPVHSLSHGRWPWRWPWRWGEAGVGAASHVAAARWDQSATAEATAAAAGIIPVPHPTVRAGRVHRLTAAASDRIPAVNGSPWLPAVMQSASKGVPTARVNVILHAPIARANGRTSQTDRQDSRADQQTDRQDTRTDRQGDRQDTRTDRQGEREDSRTERQDERATRQEDRQGTRTERRENYDGSYAKARGLQENRQDYLDDYYDD